MAGDLTPYLALVPPQHQTAPNFMALLTAMGQPLVDNQATLLSFSEIFDLDNAVGDQLDIIGQWINVTRQLSEPITGVYFVLDGYPGLDQGILQGPYDPTTGLVALPDDQFRTLIRARISSNRWDGTVDGANQVLAGVFPDNVVFIQDNQDMSIYICVAGGNMLDALTFALLTGGYLDLKAAGVRVAGYVTTSVVDAPIFGLDADNSVIGGLDHGALATFYEAT